ncbi:kinase-like protein, partial [Imleria badia]
NVLLDHNYIARLTDFGYASMIGDLPEASVYLQMTTMKPGTLRWAAPEHFLVDEEQTMQPTTQSDIYSFGNLGLLILSGKHPWSEIQRDAAVMMQLSRGNTPKRPSSPPIEDQHWELIERCWSSVGDRPCA